MCKMLIYSAQLLCVFVCVYITASCSHASSFLVIRNLFTVHKILRSIPMNQISLYAFIIRPRKQFNFRDKRFKVNLLQPDITSVYIQTNKLYLITTYIQ